jgi:predicted nucleotide-binding protein
MTGNHQVSVFVGSSVEGLPIVDAIVVNLEQACEVVPWTTMFDPSEYTLEALESSLDGFDFAILVLTADDRVECRGTLSNAPRDNVLLELGLFIGKLGRRRTIVVTDRSVDLKLPSDLAGLTQANYSPHRNGNFRSALGAACVRIKEVITTLGPRNDMALTYSISAVDAVANSSPPTA